MLTLQYVPYSEISSLTTDSRIKKLLNIVKNERIVLLEGRLEPREETQLIEKTMELINKTFKGIEICTVYPERKSKDIWPVIKSGILRMFGHKTGLTLIGPASIVKEIRKDPNKIELFTKAKRNK